MSRPPAVTLTDEERTTLEIFVHRGKANARTLSFAEREHQLHLSPPQFVLSVPPLSKSTADCP